MRRPHVASAGSFRKRLRKKQIQRRPRSASAKAASLPNNELETAVREPMRCVFGAVRVGALLGRVRLHLQTDRFLAAHRGDALWEEACREAGLGLAEIVARMAEREMAAALAPQCTPDSGATRSAGLPRAAKGLQPGMSLPGVGDDHSSTGPTPLGTGRNACATDAALKRGATSFSAATSRHCGSLRRTTTTNMLGETDDLERSRP
jgi:hypothetical protein